MFVRTYHALTQFIFLWFCTYCIYALAYMYCAYVYRVLRTCFLFIHIYNLHVCVEKKNLLLHTFFFILKVFYWDFNCVFIKKKESCFEHIENHFVKNSISSQSLVLFFFFFVTFTNLIRCIHSTAKKETTVLFKCN